jgi:AcrR family transcriptional regulator
MAVETQTNATSKTPMSRDRVLGAAVELADAEGIESLTMRRLAKELGVEAMTLYYYVPNKDAILNGIVDLVFSEMELPAAGGDWKRELRSSSISAHRVLLRHRWGAAIALKGGVHPSRLRYMDAVLGCLRSAGFSAEMTHHAYHALESHIMGFTLWLVGMALDATKLPDLAASFLSTLSRDDFPHVAEHVQTHFDPAVEYTGTEFEFGLDLILDGLERLRPAA